MRRWIRLAPTLGVCAVVATAEAGSARDSFSVTAEVVKRCAIDSSSADPRVICPKGTPTPRIGSAPGVAAPGPTVTAPSPRILEATTLDGTAVMVSVDF